MAHGVDHLRLLAAQYPLDLTGDSKGTKIATKDAKGTKPPTSFMVFVVFDDVVMSCRYFVCFVTICVSVVACGGKGSRGVTTPTKVPRISRTRFLAFGDSITAGEVTQPVGAADGIGKLVLVPAASYPSQLQSRLASTYTEQASLLAVTNAGVSNETLLEGVPRFDATFPSSRAEIVLLQEGVNNLGLIGPDTSTGLMRMMVQKAKEGGARVYVGSMIPIVSGRTRSANAAALVAYNNVLQIMCTQENVRYVDLYGAMLPDAATLIGSDGLHPTEAGYRRIAELFFTVLRADLEEP